MADRVSAEGTPVDPKTVKNWYREIGLGYRKISKDIAGGSSPDRNAQFDRIHELIGQWESEGNPCFSVDTKAKEFLGQLYRKGRTYGSEPFHAFDHDFPSWADGVVIPHGIYDIQRNVGHINIGLSRDTSEFAVDSLSWYVIAGAAMLRIATCSSVTFNCWPSRLVCRSALPTCRVIAASTIQSNAGSFLTSAERVRGCCLIASRRLWI